MCWEWRKIALAAALIAAASPARAQDGNPYVLRVDRQPYVLNLPRAAGNIPAASGASSPAPLAREKQTRAEESFFGREREYELRIAQLVRERDAWKQRADGLEAELRAARGSLPAFVHPAPTAR